MSEIAHGGSQEPSLEPGGANSGRAKQRALEARAAQRRPEVFRLRRAGMPYLDIAERFGLSVSTVWEDYQTELKRIQVPPEERKEAFDSDLSKIERTLYRIEAAMSKTDLPGEQLVRLALAQARVLKRKAEMVGYDAVPEIRIEATVGVEVDGSLEITAEDWERSARLVRLQDDVRPLLPDGTENIIDVTPLAPANGNGHGGA